MYSNSSLSMNVKDDSELEVEVVEKDALCWMDLDIVSIFFYGPGKFIFEWRNHAAKSIYSNLNGRR